MATYRAELYDAQSVLDFYEEADGEMFRVFAGSYCKPEMCRYSFEGKEKSDGTRILSDALAGLKNNIENTNIYTLQVFKKGRVTRDTDKKRIIAETVSTQISFQLNKPDKYMPYGGMQSESPLLVNALQKIAETNNVILSKLSAKEVDDDEDDDNKKGGSTIGAIFENPKVQELLAGLLSGIASKFLMPQNMPSMGRESFTEPRGMAGVPDQENLQEQVNKAREAIDLLSKRDPAFGDHLLYLAKLSDSKYNMLLSFVN